MTRLLVALLALASVAAAADAPATPAARAVESYLGTAELRPMPAPTDAWLFAAAEAGGYGWASLRLDVWFPAIDGTFNDGNGGEIDADADLGLGGNEATIVPRAFLSLGGVAMILDGFEFSAHGESTFTRTITFGGVTFQVNEDVVTDVEMTSLRGLFAVSIVGTSFLRVSLLGGISYYDLNLTIQSQTTGEGSVSVPVPVPVIGVLGQARLSRVLFELEVSGLAVDYGDIDASYLNVQASVGVMFFKVLAVRAGYRFVMLDGTLEDVAIDATLDGFFVGGTLNF
jgi:hypothetical protein